MYLKNKSIKDKINYLQSIINVNDLYGESTTLLKTEPNVFWCGHLTCDVGYPCDNPCDAKNTISQINSDIFWCGHLACDVGYPCDINSKTSQARNFLIFRQ